ECLVIQRRRVEGHAHAAVRGHVDCVRDEIRLVLHDQQIPGQVPGEGLLDLPLAMGAVRTGVDDDAVRSLLIELHQGVPCGFVRIRRDVRDIDVSPGEEVDDLSVVRTGACQERSRHSGGGESHGLVQTFAAPSAAETGGRDRLSGADDLRHGISPVSVDRAEDQRLRRAHSGPLFLSHRYRTIEMMNMKTTPTTIGNHVRLTILSGLSLVEPATITTTAATGEQARKRFPAMHMGTETAKGSIPATFASSYISGTIA